jgi:hypothetical protein
MLKNVDGRDFIMISIDPRSKLSKKKKLRIKKNWSTYPRALNINFQN